MRRDNKGSSKMAECSQRSIIKRLCVELAAADCNLRHAITEQEVDQQRLAKRVRELECKIAEAPASTQADIKLKAFAALRHDSDTTEVSTVQPNLLHLLNRIAHDTVAL
jgi:hypothetical protein